MDSVLFSVSEAVSEAVSVSGIRVGVGFGICVGSLLRCGRCVGLGRLSGCAAGGSLISGTGDKTQHQQGDKRQAEHEETELLHGFSSFHLISWGCFESTLFILAQIFLFVKSRTKNKRTIRVKIGQKRRGACPRRHWLDLPELSPAGGVPPAALACLCPGGEDHLKRRSSSPPVPPLLGCRHCS